MRRPVRWFTITSLALIVMLMQASAFLLEAAPTRRGGEPSGPPGPHPIGVDELSIDGATPVEALIWYPAEASDGAPFAYSLQLELVEPVGRFSVGTYEGSAVRGAPVGGGSHPLVVLSPGFAMSSSSYAWLAEHLASYGFVVVAPDHHESLDPSRLGLAAVARPDDVRAVLDHIGGSGPFAGLVDNDRVAVVGHSLGGFTALAAGGARLDTSAFEQRCQAAYTEHHPSAWLCDALLPQVDEMAEAAGLGEIPDGLWPAMGDERVDAVVTMAGDAFLFGADGLAEVDVPVLAIGGTADRDSPFEWTTQLAHDNVSSSVREILPLPDAGHMIFANPCETTRRLILLAPNDFCFDEHWERTDAHEEVASRTTAFLGRVLGVRLDATPTATLVS